MGGAREHGLKRVLGQGTRWELVVVVVVLEEVVMMMMMMMEVAVQGGELGK